ncbi:hypothetical protein GUITHDRAFT_73331 [Guillardia theta CCMP2712]|uniref:riboflavin kinase n=1 Tax=Guillardia theta (strain CCMP2712) TaxID=905079 RepID=L1J4S6_GUITC|nr:hypothetical protein GUITHDRAFT_73331 [Guillardia theta CCMP2712]EKX43095.1 hypothetical protein GUITHDRAFT_73331 [Guillardia theta CCMP2712]|eukprot:XP_005830075.1 hypothetical protein GUITHDRAFT_73331 [Guillardia theta CCMP2712]
MREPRALEAPVRMSGEVVKGFGRGSKVLGIPTANLPHDALKQLPRSFETGIYFGWATVDGVGPYKMVTSVGWNPQFANTSMTVEPHLLHSFPDDFYGSSIKIVIVGHLRAEAKFESLESLIDEIHLDISSAGELLDCEPYSFLRSA